MASIVLHCIAVAVHILNTKHRIEYFKRWFEHTHCTLTLILGNLHIWHCSAAIPTAISVNGAIAKTIMQQKHSSQLAHLPWTTMDLFPVLLCINNICSMTAMMAGGEVHRPSGVQQDIWNWVTLCSWPDCRRTCRKQFMVYTDMECRIVGILLCNICTSCFNCCCCPSAAKDAMRLFPLFKTRWRHYMSTWLLIKGQEELRKSAANYFKIVKSYFDIGDGWGGHTLRLVFEQARERLTHSYLQPRKGRLQVTGSKKYTPCNTTRLHQWKKWVSFL